MNNQVKFPNQKRSPPHCKDCFLRCQKIRKCAFYCAKKLWFGLQFIDFTADQLNMVKAIQQRMAVYSHPKKQCMKSLVCVEDVGSIDFRPSKSETYRFVMSYTVSQDIDAIQFIKHECIVVLNTIRGAWFIREDCKQTVPGCVILWIGKHVFPYSELHFGKQFGMSITTSIIQAPICPSNYVCSALTPSIVENASWQYSITQPVITKTLYKYIVDSISYRYLKAAQQSKYLLR